MSAKIEKLLKEYPSMVRERSCLVHQIAHFRGVTAEEVIESMYTPIMDGERVQTSGTSDKTAQIALNYRARRERVNQEWYECLKEQHQQLDEEIAFFEAALGSLSGKLPAIMQDMIVEGMTWNALAGKYYVSQRMIGKYRKKAIAELDEFYADRDIQTTAFLLE